MQVKQGRRTKQGNSDLDVYSSKHRNKDSLDDMGTIEVEINKKQDYDDRSPSEFMTNLQHHNNSESRTVRGYKKHKLLLREKRERSESFETRYFLHSSVGKKNSIQVMKGLDKLDFQKFKQAKDHLKTNKLTSQRHGENHPPSILKSNHKFGFKRNSLPENVNTAVKFIRSNKNELSPNPIEVISKLQNMKGFSSKRTPGLSKASTILGSTPVGDQHAAKASISTSQAISDIKTGPLKVTKERNYTVISGIGMQEGHFEEKNLEEIEIQK